MAEAPYRDPYMDLYELLSELHGGTLRHIEYLDNKIAEFKERIEGYNPIKSEYNRNIASLEEDHKENPSDEADPYQEMNRLRRGYETMSRLINEAERDIDYFREQKKIEEETRKTQEKELTKIDKEIKQHANNRANAARANAGANGGRRKRTLRSKRRRHHKCKTYHKRR
jgi:chromosome segregation ATPase